ncbi:probable receptor-like protein kinase At5g59700 [Lolium rigidum]|uniref:probable receptor-like protein kinase At5g59700 n=1 Tax=Lolium rigidum TaxID=89674 RepID=UPI001F5D1198|nr:probable receptor-like protein kinase At5g59700 [Lolium rigidum]
MSTTARPHLSPRSSSTTRMHAPRPATAARHRSTTTTTSMAVLVTLLLATLLPRAALAAFSPDSWFFLACGASASVAFPSDSPSRTFVPDSTYLSNGRGSFVVATSNAASPLYAAARAGTSGFSYRLPAPAAQDAAAFLVLRLHFFPVATLSSARFTVSVFETYTLLTSFSPPTAGVVKEFFVPRGAGAFTIKFSPDAGSSAFVNAVELFPAPTELLWNSSVVPVGALSSNDLSSWQQDALETVYRLNVGGPKVTKENGTLWRTWLPDGPFLHGAPGQSVVNSTATRINYSGYTSDLAPDVVYQTQRAANVTAFRRATTPGLNFNVTWTFPAERGASYLVRLHFCDYEMLSSVIGVGIKFNVYVAQAIGTIDLSPKDLPQVTQSNVAFYFDYAARAPRAGNLTVSIGRSPKSIGAGILNGLEIMKLQAANMSPPAAVHSRRTKIMIIALSVVLGAAVLGCVLLWFFVVRPKRRRQAALDEKENTQMPPPPWTPYTPDSASGWPDQSTNRSSEGTGDRMQRVSTKLHVPLPEIKGATDNFHDRNLIGVGGFGNVYKGVLPRDGTPVAVKRAMRASKQGLPEFQTEIVVLSSIRHRHLVSLIGYCNEQGEMILVYEYMEKGTLRGHLYGSDEPSLSWKQRLEICIGAARGLHYLHSGYSENIIHRDVKSTNILLGAGEGSAGGVIAKVADFGLSRIGPSFGETHVSTAVKGSFGYLDPEYFKTQQLTDRSDVYSFGVVLFEVLCARPVIDQSLDRDQINIAEWALRMHSEGQLDKIVDARIAGEVNENSLRKFAETAEKCLEEYGVDRPTMGEVVWNLEYCLQLQETQVNRDAFEDSGAVTTQLPADMVVPRWVPSSTNLSMDEADETVMTMTDVSDSQVFSQLDARGEGR